ncbi:Putative Ca2+/H+ antiporter, TMEM165/GDT1 family [Haloplanus vescus]|uniref:Putative Ca2+/H+ antiporter, TMEM165/GDT1 family n=1 Tax=Haloplanus vescus TaxID=555874 RepID=A0A1H3WII8_9EURY|nr:TMEM165/GDT1 family protein [Haloplanus vescus]SDZ86760.1 Putative Ca2+/H+ antiporter, TMEM165/GDT1 family [Haloplanus vescus]
MTGWMEILTVAFVSQLVVLPGEKVQFIIAGLATRYNPLVVVSAASAAFAGWTVLEILFGQALQSALPPVVLDALTAGLFLLFAVLLYRSAPSSGDWDQVDPTATDGGITSLGSDFQPKVFGRELPEVFGGFFPIFAMMAAGEFGDKTQLVTIGLAAQYGAHPAIWAGEMLAIVPVSLANAYFSHRFAHRLNMRTVHFFSAGLFAFFATDTVLSIVTGFSVWETVIEVVSTAVLSLV